MSAIRGGVRCRLSLPQAIVLGIVTVAGKGASAATATANLGVSITIDATCAISSVSDVAFGSVGLLNADIPSTGSFDVECTSGTTYSISLGVGNGTGATVAQRYMSFGAHTVEYSLYIDAGHTQLWGVTIGSDTVAGTGDGTPQTYTVYGLVPSQSTPPAGTYNDTVVISVDY